MKNNIKVFGEQHAIEVLILGPVTPYWDNGNFCYPLKDYLLDHHYKITIIDTLSLFDSVNLNECLKNIYNYLKNNFSTPALLVGYALGGTVAMKLPKLGYDVDSILTISAPGYVDAELMIKLKKLISFLQQQKLDQCLNLLEYYVAPLGTKRMTQAISIPPLMKEDACRRMELGFTLLAQADARESIANFKGNLLCLVGELSQLATSRNQAVTPGASKQNLRSVSAAGMRTLIDNPKETLNIVKQWLLENHA